MMKVTKAAQNRAFLRSAILFSIAIVFGPSRNQTAPPMSKLVGLEQIKNTLASL
jgi:hypothetical protein